MGKRVRRSARQRLETKYQIASEDQRLREILGLIESGGKLTEDQNSYAIQHFRMIKRAMAVAQMPFVVEHVVGSFFYKPGAPYPLSNNVRAALSLPLVAGKKRPTQPTAKKPARRPISVSEFDPANPTQAAIDDFYASWEWARLRYRVMQEFGRVCMSCGANPSDGVRIVCDHVKPVRKYWHLRLDPKNLQVLCDPCNMGKGSWDETDFRPVPATTAERIDTKGAWPPKNDDPPPWLN